MYIQASALHIYDLLVFDCLRSLFKLADYLHAQYSNNTRDMVNYVLYSSASGSLDQQKHLSLNINNINTPPPVKAVLQYIIAYQLGTAQGYIVGSMYMLYHHHHVIDD